MFSSRTKFTSLLLFSAGLAVSVALPGVAQPAVSNSVANPDPQQILNQACTVLKQQRSFALEMDITYDNVLDTGSKVQYSAYQKVWVQKPNQLRSDYVGDERNSRFYYNGQSFALESPLKNLYATADAPTSIDAAINQIQQQYGVSLPMSNLFLSDPCAALEDKVNQSFFIGMDMVNRNPAYHLLFVGDDRDWQIWIQPEPKPLPIKVVITYKNLPGAPQYTALLSNWNLTDTPFAADLFNFKPATGAAKIEFLPATSSVP